MHRHFLHARDAFPTTIGSYTRELEAALRQKRTDNDKAWEEVDEGWKELNERMVEIGVRPPTREEGILRLNAGGSCVNIWLSELEQPCGSPSASIFVSLLQSVWDNRVPRDAEGRIVLDESPACLKHIIYKLTVGQPLNAVNVTLQDASKVMSDEKPYLYYLGHLVIGLPEHFLPPFKFMQVVGGSTILKSHDRPLSSVIRNWCPGNPSRMELIYRASRDGASSKAFHASCKEDSPQTITLIKVNSGNGKHDSIVGGFAKTSWESIKSSGESWYTPGGFTFILKDGTATDETNFQPIKWERKSVQGYRSCGPYFGDLCVNFNPITISTIGKGANKAFLALNGKSVVEIEVFRVGCTTELTETSSASTCEMTSQTPCYQPRVIETEEGDSRIFAPISGLLAEERVALQYAQNELVKVGVKVTAAAELLATVYGPDVAAGKRDTVVELNIRGTFVTTLSSTLQACPDSALAARFNENTWPANGKDADEHGRRFVDCDPACFSKILDVLRMRKRAGWVLSDSLLSPRENDAEAVRVVVKAADRLCFEEFVNMYFPACESFIMDLVDFEIS